MSKPVALSLGIGAAGTICLAIAAASSGPIRWAAAWTALSCVLAASAYAANRPSLFGKTDGRLAWHRRVVMGPYLAAFAIACAIMRRYRDAAPVDEIVPGLWVGGRLRGADVPTGVGLIVDLVAEFAEPAAVRELPGYRCLPVLDGGYPADDDALVSLVAEAAACRLPVVVHCDSGKGRAPTFAALVLIRRRLADDPEAAVELVRRGRPATAPTASDMAYARRILPRLLAGGTSGVDAPASATPCARPVAERGRARA